MNKSLLAIVALLTFNTACTIAPAHRLNADEPGMPKDFVVIDKTSDVIALDIRYHTDNNFVGTQIDGYHAAHCVLQKQAAEGLLKAAKAANADGYRLKIFDCYRPQRAVNHFVRWSEDLTDTQTKSDYYPKIAKSDILGPYVAAKSGHSRGSTLDVTLQTKNPRGQWQDLDMGTRFDFFDSASNTAHPDITERVADNRARLIGYMQRGNFKNYPMEWWHFSYKNEAYPKTYFDFPIR